MEIIESKNGKVTVFAFKGEAKANRQDINFQQLIAARINQGERQFVVNLADCTFIDSKWLGELVRSFAHVMRHGGMLKLASVQLKVHDLLTVTNLTQVFEIHHDEQAAVDSF
jgi:anti-anti-sigma factor